jgi:threonine dehydrogenase-like Zn-dependent dehydrogenase
MILLSESRCEPGRERPINTTVQPACPGRLAATRATRELLSSLGVYSGKLSVPLEPFAAGLGGHKIVTTLCPGGKERMRRLIELVRNGRLDLRPLLTHVFPLARITEAYRLFSERRDGVIKIAIRP